MRKPLPHPVSNNRANTTVQRVAQAERVTLHGLRCIRGTQRVATERERHVGHRTSASTLDHYNLDGEQPFVGLSREVVLLRRQALSVKADQGSGTLLGCLQGVDADCSYAQGTCCSSFMPILYCNRLVAAAVMAVTPVRRVGSGSGSKRLVCMPGSVWPAACAAASFAGSMAPSRKYTTGIGSGLP